MEMNDNTILRIKVPAHLYESVKAQLTLNEANLTLQNYARKLYSLFKKSGATPLVQTGKNFASPDVKNSNVSIGVSGDKLHVGIKGSKDIGKKYADLVAKEFTDLQLQGQITQSGWGGQNDATYTNLTLVPKTTGKKGGTTVTETEDTIKEAKQNFGTKDMKPVKGQKAAGTASDKPKATKPAAPKKANAPGRGLTEKKEYSLQELAKAYEALTQKIAQMEGGEQYLKEYNPYYGDFESRYDRGGRVTDEPGEAAYTRDRNLRKNWKYMTPADRTAAMKKTTTEPGGEKFDEPVKGDEPIYGPKK